jgi:ArsR family transcriptional regulator, nickel/cobalt-responsive transcriptional repressor
MALAAATSSTCAKILRVLAEQTRLDVVIRLLDGPLHVHELNAGLDIEPTLLSHHLRTLRDAGLVVARRDGKAVLYALSPRMMSARHGRTLDLTCCKLRFN